MNWAVSDEVRTGTPRTVLRATAECDANPWAGSMKVCAPVANLMDEISLYEELIWASAYTPSVVALYLNGIGGGP
jgi:hypothetical protein